MTGSARPSLSRDEVARIARLARLRLDDAQLESYREQLAAVLQHIDHLGGIDVTGIEPLAHPGEQVNRFRDDEITGAPLDPEPLLALAPAREGDFIAVPKVLGGGEEG